MMKYIFFFHLLFFVSNVFAFECKHRELQENYIYEVPAGATLAEQEEIQSEKIDTHLALASDVFIGTVILGEKASQKIKFKMSIAHSFKGQKKDSIDVVTVRSSISPEIVLGGSYLMFLYGDNEVDFCSLIKYFGAGESDIAIEDLKAMINTNPDVKPLIRKLLNKVVSYEE